MPGIEIPSEWERLDLRNVGGVVLLVGATDTGKTTLARYLYGRLRAGHERVAFLDGDVGQAILGPPTTTTIALSGTEGDGFPPSGPVFRTFVGDISPMGHMLPIVVGAQRLVERAQAEGATACVVDTTGFVAAARGGGALKLALVDLLRPQLVVALQRGTELEHLTGPLRRSRRTRLVEADVPTTVRHRDRETRRAHRRAQYRRTFAAARLLNVNWSQHAVIPAPTFTRQRLMALEDEEGFVLALGIVTEVDLRRERVELLTTLRSLDDVDALRVGDVAVNPETFEDRRLSG